MTSWAEFAQQAPEFAEFGSARFRSGVAYLGTLRVDGSPRVHPVTPILGEQLFLFMEPTSPKGKDLQRDPRYTLHCSVEDSSGGSGEFVHRGLEPEAASRLDGVGDGLAPSGVDDEILGNAVDELDGGRAARGAGDPGACKNSGRCRVQSAQLAVGDGEVGAVRVRAAIRVTAHQSVSRRVVGLPPCGADPCPDLFRRFRVSSGC